MKILVINGPNLNFLGIREPEIYGKQTYFDLYKMLEEKAKLEEIDLEVVQSNYEGKIIDYIQSAYYEKVDGIIINPAGYTHTSVAILDALKAVMIPCVEVHISDVSEREEFRKHSYISMFAKKTIKVKWFKGYLEAIDYLIK